MHAWNKKKVEILSVSATRISKRLRKPWKFLCVCVFFFFPGPSIEKKLFILLALVSSKIILMRLL